MINMAKNCEFCSFLEVHDLKQILNGMKHYGYWLLVLMSWELSIHWTAYTGIVRFFPGVLLTACFAALLTLLIELPGWAGRICSWILPPVIALIYGVQLIYYDIFGGLLSLAFVSAGGDAVTTFYTVILGAIWRRLPQVLLLILPIAGYHVLRHFRLLGEIRFAWHRIGALVIAAALLCGAGVMVLPAYGAGANQPAALFRNANATIDQWAEYFGILTSEILDLSRQGETAAPVVSVVPPIQVELPPEQDDRKWNRLEELDFDALDAKTDDEALKTLNAYFRALPATEQHAYTGLFKGYNLIVVCAEAFSNYVIDPELTPTLYRMSREGIVFENFYNSFPNLTTNGEYSLCMGLMPDLSRMSFAVSIENDLPYALGNICTENGMKSYAYHNNVGTFYNRVNTHTNMGYEFKAVDFGLDMVAGSPSSDLEMMRKTVADYITQEPFHAYYMTYSGHSDYDFETNEMSIKNQSAVEHLQASEQVRAYIACQLELEEAMAYLLRRLEQEGIADRTVVVLTGDHLPYGLTEDAYAELAGEEAVQEPFWQYKNSFLCWTGGLEETIVVDDYCCTMDILPTLLNLFGLPYDSRLLTGRDVLADTTHMALLKDGSFLTDTMIYDAPSGEITWAGDEDPALAESLQQYAANQFAISSAILGTDYYRFALNGLELKQEDPEVKPELGQKPEEKPEQDLAEEPEPEEPQAGYSSYADIAGTWYEEAVELLTRYGALSGDATGAFNGNQPASRADVVAMLTRSLGLQGSHGSHVFEDVAEDAWYHDVISAAADAGWIVKIKTFRPQENVTVGDTMMFLFNAGAGKGLIQMLETVEKKQQQEGYLGKSGTLSRGAAAWMVAWMLKPEALPELELKPEEPPKPVWIPIPEPEPEPDIPLIIPDDPLAQPAEPEPET